VTGDRTTSVLIIDSDNVRRGMLACSLPASHYSLEFANSPEKGLDLVVRVEPQVVIIGWSGPSDLCQRIRSLQAGHSCTLVLMDERFRDESVGQSEVEASGADAFLPFPFEVDLLERHLLATPNRKPPGPVPDPMPGVAQQLPPLGHQAAPASRPPADDQRLAWQEFRERVQRIHDQLEQATYYELLQVSEGAGAGAIKQAFFDRSIEYHPDRFIRLEDEDLKAQIYEIFKRMSEAFKVLASPEARSRYDTNLAGPGRETRFLDRDRGPLSPKEDPTADARTPAGKKYLHYALLAETEGKLRSARMYLSMALQYEPENDALHNRLEQVTRRFGS